MTLFIWDFDGIIYSVSEFPLIELKKGLVLLCMKTDHELL